MEEIGVIHGRFQIFHLKHMEYMLAVKMRCRKLIVGIMEPDGGRTERNPLTYYERFEMIHDALIDFGVKREEFEIVPFPIERGEVLLNYVPQEAVYYMSMVDEFEEEKLKILDILGLKTEILWRKSPGTKGITGTEVRECIAAGKEWRSLVPKTVYQYMVTRGLDERIRRMKA